MLHRKLSPNLYFDLVATNFPSRGFCRTDFTGGQGVKEASDGAKVIVRAAIEGDPKELYGTLVADEGTQFGW